MASSSLCGSPPTKNNLQPTPLTLTPGQLKPNHQSLYVQFECTDKSEEGNSNVSNDKSQESTLCSITTVLMNKQNYFPSHKTDNCGKKNIQQYNMIVSYVKSKKYGVQGVYLTEYVDAIQTFSDILWEIDLHYQKLVTRRYLFPDAIVDNFLGFNDSKLHGHAVKPFNKNSLSLKITKLLTLSDRRFMRQQHMKPFVDMINQVCNSISKYIDYLDEQSIRTSESRNGEKSHGTEESIESYTVTKIKMFCATCDQLAKFKKLRDVLIGNDVYVPIKNM